jgi:dTDP-4-amino-4,6-dideoxygalactose transaminase
MRKLAMHGGPPIVQTPIKPLNVIGHGAVAELHQFMIRVAEHGELLSGYLAGSERGGAAVQRLEELWAHKFKVRHAIACNSGSSALLAACAAVYGRRVVVPTMGMSAVAAMPLMLRAPVAFADVDDWFCLDPEADLRAGDIVFAVNLFGHPAQLQALKARCDALEAILLEDACQSYWATEFDKLTGTIGTIGCYSFNQHKFINAGEGGMLVTNDDSAAQHLRGFINHAECSHFAANMIGGNFRMTEPTAMLVLSQLQSAQEVVWRRQYVWHQLAMHLPPLFAHDYPLERIACETAAYCFAFLAPTQRIRDFTVAALNAEGVPCRNGYILIHKLSYFRHLYGNLTLPRAEDFNARMILIELTAIDPTDQQVHEMCDAIEAVAAEIEELAQ